MNNFFPQARCSLGIFRKPVPACDFRADAGIDTGDVTRDASFAAHPVDLPVALAYVSVVITPQG